MSGRACVANGNLGTAQLCGASSTPASATDNCAAGDGCIILLRDDGTALASQCLQYCSSDSDCRQPVAPGGIAGRCDIDLGSYSVCTDSCNPVGAADGTNGCPHGLSCQYIIETMRDLLPFEVTNCQQYGAQREGQSCTGHDCAPGLTCFASVCRKVCTDPSQCAAGVPCNSTGEVLFDHFGLCTPSS